MEFRSFVSFNCATSRRFRTAACSSSCLSCFSANASCFAALFDRLVRAAGIVGSRSEATLVEDVEDKSSVEAEAEDKLAVDRSSRFVDSLSEHTVHKLV